ncbi:MAG: glycosyltransferase family 2 protein [Flavobacteriaceae bacterium]
MENELFNVSKIAIVIPYYNAADHIEKVVAKIPEYIDGLIIVNDKSKDVLPQQEILARINNTTQCYFIENTKNLGVGGATKKGFEHALEKGYDIIIKVDADNQMDLSYLPALLEPLISGTIAVTKGNRFRNFRALQKMPVPRKIGNLILSFLTKIATGYWHNFDPTNGFIALKAEVLRKIDFEKLSNRYYFETSLLAELYFQKTLIKDIDMPAIYADEKSSMNVAKMVFVFFGKLSRTFVKRILKEYFLYDFNIGSVYIFFGLPLLLFGIIFGLFEWIHYATLDIFAPTGTIMIVTLSIILGFQLMLQAIQYDIFNSPNGNLK